MEITGRIIQVLPPQQGTSQRTGNVWRNQDYVLENNEGQFPRKICFRLRNDNIDRYALQVGDFVTASIDIESREWNGRWYTDVTAWKVEKGEPAPAPQYADPNAAPAFAAPAPAAAAQPVVPQFPGAAPEPSATDDLPF